MTIQAIVEQPSATDDRRETARWRIRLDMPAALGEGRANLVIHDISTAGMLMETGSQLEIGQSLILSLPESDPVTACIVWQNAPLFGCRFDQPLSPAVVSAVRLRSPASVAPKIIARPSEAEAAPELGEHLRRLRQEQGLTRAALSERTGFSKPTIWGWETGRTTPRKGNLLILAGIFGLTERQLLFGEGLPVCAQAKAPHAPSLQMVIDLSKAEIARAAGVAQSRVHIHIEF